MEGREERKGGKKREKKEREGRLVVEGREERGGEGTRWGVKK